jgi:hypothetical protein
LPSAGGCKLEIGKHFKYPFAIVDLITSYENLIKNTVAEFEGAEKETVPLFISLELDTDIDRRPNTWTYAINIAHKEHI